MLTDAWLFAAKNQIWMMLCHFKSFSNKIHKKVYNLLVSSSLMQQNDSTDTEQIGLTACFQCSKTTKQTTNGNIGFLIKNKFFKQLSIDGAEIQKLKLWMESAKRTIVRGIYFEMNCLLNRCIAVNIRK